MGFFSWLFGGGQNTSARPDQGSAPRPAPPPPPPPTSSPRVLTLAPADDDDDPHDIVGESYYQDALASLAGPKTEDGADEWVTATLVPEPTNPYDSNAVAVLVEEQKVGHLSRGDAPALLRLLAATGAEMAECDGSIEGGWKNSRTEGSYCVRLDIAWPPRADV